jgi:hypothetical protein
MHTNLLLRSPSAHVAHHMQAHQHVAHPQRKPGNQQTDTCATCFAAHTARKHSYQRTPADTQPSTHAPAQLRTHTHTYSPKAAAAPTKRARMHTTTQAQQFKRQTLAQLRTCTQSCCCAHQAHTPHTTMQAQQSRNRHPRSCTWIHTCAQTCCCAHQAHTLQLLQAHAYCTSPRKRSKQEKDTRTTAHGPPHAHRAAAAPTERAHACLKQTQN